VPPPASTNDVGGLVLLGAGGALLLLLALALARMARRRSAAEAAGLTRRRAGKKKSFAAGHLVGASVGVASIEDALASLRAGRVAAGRVESVDAPSDGTRAHVAVRRKRSEPCDLVAGYLTGLFESAWASDITLRHEACAGKSKNALCVYELRPVSHRAAPAAAASSAGSASGLRRWPPAPRGGG
jgi:hypothetical protein